MYQCISFSPRLIFAPGCSLIGPDIPNVPSTSLELCWLQAGAPPVISSVRRWRLTGVFHRRRTSLRADDLAEPTHVRKVGVSWRGCFETGTQRRAGASRVRGRPLTRLQPRRHPRVDAANDPDARLSNCVVRWERFNGSEQQFVGNQQSKTLWGRTSQTNRTRFDLSLVLLFYPPERSVKEPED